MVGRMLSSLLPSVCEKLSSLDCLSWAQWTASTGLKAGLLIVSRGSAASKHRAACTPSGNPRSPMDLIISQQLSSRNSAVGWAGNKSGELILMGEWPSDSASRHISWITCYFDLVTSHSWLLLWMSGGETWIVWAAVAAAGLKSFLFFQLLVSNF